MLLSEKCTNIFIWLIEQMLSGNFARYAEKKILYPLCEKSAHSASWEKKEIPENRGFPGFVRQQI